MTQIGATGPIGGANRNVQPVPLSAIRAASLEPAGEAPTPAPPPDRLFLECLPLPDALRYAAAWSDLTTRALEPNVFLEPGFLLPLHQHTRSPDIHLLLVWAEETPTAFSRLLGVIPLAARRVKLLRGLRHPQLTCGVPLLDAASADAVLEGALDWLTVNHPRAHGLLLEDVAADGPFATCLRRLAARRNLALATVESRTRAVLRNGREPVEMLCFRSAKRRKEHGRQVRRLAELGARGVRVAETPDAVARALEHFLALEERGWKGRQGTAFLCQPRLVTFVRTMMRHFAAEGRAAVHLLELGGRPIAIGLVLRQGERAYFWKTAYDERLAALSPGVQLTVELTRRQLADGNAAVTDSCAVADHPMIDALWPERQTMLDVAISLNSADSRRLARAVDGERRRRAARQTAKRLWARFAKLRTKLKRA